MKNNSSRRILALVGWRYLTHHPWQSILMVAGIALGVAVVVAINLANVSASRAFDISTESLTGRATHQIDGGPQGLDENIYTQLRRSGIPLLSAPVISDYVVSPQLGSQPLELLGVDPFAEAPFRAYLGSSDAVRGNGASPPQADPGSFSAFLTQPGAILLSQDLAGRYQLEPCPSGKVDAQSPEPGCRVEIESGGHPSLAFIAGLIQPGDTNTPEGRLLRRSLEGMVLADIATAQEITGKLGRLDHIDLIVPEGDFADQAQVRSLLPPGVELRPKAERSGTLEEMTAAFRLNLTALSLLALLVGMFLIYNTMTFSVVQRRELFGTLRCLGVTRREVFALVVGEAALVGILGAVLGSLLGVLLGQGAVRLVTQTINDLFFVLTVRGVQVPLSSLLVGSALGITATILSAAPAGVGSRLGPTAPGALPLQPGNQNGKIHPPGILERAGFIPGWSGAAGPALALARAELCRNLCHGGWVRLAHPAVHARPDAHRQPFRRQVVGQPGQDGAARRGEFAQPDFHRGDGTNGGSLGDHRGQPDDQQLPLYSSSLAG